MNCIPSFLITTASMYLSLYFTFLLWNTNFSTSGVHCQRYLASPLKTRLLKVTHQPHWCPPQQYTLSQLLETYINTGTITSHSAQFFKFLCITEYLEVLKFPNLHSTKGSYKRESILNSAQIMTRGAACHQRMLWKNDCPRFPLTFETLI